MSTFKCVLLWVGVVMAWCALAMTGLTRIDPGHVGIKINKAGTYRGVEDVPTVTGWVFYSPFLTTVFQYPTFVQQVVWTHNVAEGNPVNEEITFTNADQMQISVDVSLAYHIDTEKAPHFYIKFRHDRLNEFTHGYLRSLTKGQFNETGGRYHIEEIMGDNGAFVKAVKDALQKDLDPLGVKLEDQFGIIGAPRPPAAVVENINLKVQAVQIAQQKQNEVAQAEADARKRVADAEGYAKATLVRADADATANRTLAESITVNLLELKRLEKWNGRLPAVTSGAVPFITVGPK